MPYRYVRILEKFESDFGFISGQRWRFLGPKGQKKAYYWVASYPGLLLAKLSFPMARVPTQNFARKPGAVGAIFGGGRHTA